MGTFALVLNLNNILTTVIGILASSLVVYCCLATPAQELHGYRVIILWHAIHAFCLTVLYTALQIVSSILVLLIYLLFQKVLKKRSMMKPQTLTDMYGEDAFV